MSGSEDDLLYRLFLNMGTPDQINAIEAREDLAL